jgi:hypothetical protein
VVDANNAAISLNSITFAGFPNGSTFELARLIYLLQLGRFSKLNPGNIPEI